MRTKKHKFSKKMLALMLALSMVVEPVGAMLFPAITVEAEENVPITTIERYDAAGSDTILKAEDGKYSVALPKMNGQVLTSETYYGTYQNSFELQIKKDGKWVGISTVLQDAGSETRLTEVEDAYCVEWWVNEAEGWSGMGLSIKLSEDWGKINYIRFQSLAYETVYLDYKLQDVDAVTSFKFVDSDGDNKITVGAGETVALNFDYIRINDGEIGGGEYGQGNFLWSAVVNGSEMTMEEAGFTWSNSGPAGGNWGWDIYPTNAGYWFVITQSVTIRAKLKDNTALTADYVITVEKGEKGPEYNPSNPSTTGNVPDPGTNKSGYKLIWSDEFNGNYDTENVDSETGLNLDNWSYQLGDGTVEAGLSGWGNSERQCYTKSSKNIAVNENNSGLLRVTASYEADGSSVYLSEGDKYYSSARIVTKGTEETGALFNTTYGYVEARMALPETVGAWPAFWMLPQSTEIYGSWPVSGEIDIMETCGYKQDEACATLHWGSPEHVYLGSGYMPLSSSFSHFHTYAVDWEPGKITFYYDGVAIHTQTNWESKKPGASDSLSFDAPFDEPYYLLLNLAVDSGNFGGSENKATFQDDINMYVDYVRVYQKTDGYDTTNIRRTVSDSKSDWASYTGNQIAEVNADSITTAENGDVNALETSGAVDTSKWYLAYTEGGAATINSVTADDGTEWAKVDVTNAGNQNYSVQMIGHYNAKKGYLYKVSFDAYAEGNMIGQTASCDSKEWKGWSTYGINSFILEDTPTSYSFLIDQQTAFDNCRIEVNLGAMETGVVYIGNVKVEIVDPDTIGNDNVRLSKPLSSGEVIYNGTFDQGNNNVGYWNAGEDTVFSVPAYTTEKLEDDDIGVVDVAAGLAAGTGSVTKYYERRAQVSAASGVTPFIYQGGFALSKSQYTLTFDMYSEQSTTVTAAIYSTSTAEDGTQILGTKLLESRKIAYSPVDGVLNYSWNFEPLRDLQNVAVVLTFGDGASVQVDNVSILPTEKASTTDSQNMDRNLSSLIEITYVMNDNSRSPAVNADSNPFYYEKGEGTITLAEPTRAGWEFAGWSLVQDVQYVEDYVTEVSTDVSSITLYANWGERVTDSKNPDTTVSVTGVELDKTATVSVGNTVTLNATVKPDNATTKTVEWSTDQPTIATVDKNGVVTGHTAGTALITVTTVDGGKTATCNVTVTDNSTATISVQSISLNTNTLSLSEGDSAALMPTVLPEDATNKNVTWTSTNPDVVSVDENGIVTAKSAGSGVIIVTTVDGGKTATCNVTVTGNSVETVAVQSVSLNESALALTEGDSKSLTVTVLPENATNKNVTWKSSNSGVVSVDENGIVTAISAGTAAIIVTTVDGGKIATCNVTVAAKQIAVPVTYTVTFNSNGGTPVSPQVVTAGGVVVRPTDPVRDRYVFAGWYVESGEYNFAQAVNGNLVLTARWTEIKVSSIKITGISKKIAMGKKVTLTAAVSPSNVTNGTVTWKSSNTKYATVNANGVVTTKKAGKNKTVTITATAADGSGIKATYKIKIMPKAVKSISLKASATTVKAGKKVTIKTKVTPSNKKQVNTTLAWTSSNTNYATVNAKGVVTTKKAGKGKKVKITAKATDGSDKKKTVTIKIK